MQEYEYSSRTSHSLRVAWDFQQLCLLVYWLPLESTRVPSLLRAGVDPSPDDFGREVMQKCRQ